MNEAKKRHDQENELAIHDCWNHIGVWGNEQPRCPKLETVIHCRNCETYSSIGQYMLDRSCPERYLEEWSDIYSKEKLATDANKQSAIIFRLGDEWFAISSSVIKEISHMRTVHSLPHSRTRLIRGITNIRGELKVCASLGTLLGITKGTKTRKLKGMSVYERLVVISKDGQDFVFPVSELPGTHKYLLNEVSPVPSTVSNARATYTKGILTWEEHHVALLDEELVLYSIERDLS